MRNADVRLTTSNASGSNGLLLGWQRGKQKNCGNFGRFFAKKLAWFGLLNMMQAIAVLSIDGLT